MQTSALHNSSSLSIPPSTQGLGNVERLEASDAAEVAEFLGCRSLHTAYLSGLIRDNGIDSPNNRGTFYCFRNGQGQLEGVALIGHAILMEANNPQAIRAFANVAQHSKNAHLIMCDESTMEIFWSAYRTGEKEPRRTSRQHHFELRWPLDSNSPLASPRLAVMADLDSLLPIHAEMARDESGVDPRVVDPKGFAERYARRISQDRTWIWVENGQVQFKADVISETPETTYIEGVWINPEIRGRGYGRSCMSQLARLLLWRTKSLCVSVNDENQQAISFFKQAGYHMRGVYDTIFLK
jgi:ribosomal protein S18 acetylase RimI-like enzyme